MFESLFQYLFLLVVCSARSGFCLPVQFLPGHAVQDVEVLLASLFGVLVLIFLILLCGSCLKSKNGHTQLQETGDLNLTSVVVSSPHSTVYTIDDEVTFEPLPDIDRFKNVKKENRKFSGNLQLASVPLVEVDKLSEWLSHPSSACQRQKLQYLKVLGGGWFGQSVEAEGRDLVPGDNQSRCVVKILRPDASTQEMIRFLNEVRCYKDVNHTNVLKLVGACLESYPKLVVLQHCSNGNLKSYLLDQQKIGYIPSASALTKMSLDVANGLHCLHSKGFVHPDLAARNCLVTSKGSILIGDYGISKETHKADYYEIGGATIPIRWVAPEDVFVSEKSSDTVVAQYQASSLGNVWSIGIIFWEIFELGRLPYYHLSDEEVIENVIIAPKSVVDRPQRQPSGDALYHLMLQCCASEQQIRPSVENIIAILSGLHAITLRSDIDFDTRWDQLQRQSSAFSDGASVDDSLFGMPDFEDSLKVNYSKSKEASDDDLAYTEKVNEALRTLDRALMLEEFDVRPNFDLSLGVMHDRFGAQTVDTQQLDSLTPSYLDVEARVERGEFEDLVREKSRSVTDLMRLTHVENGSESLSYSDKEPLLDKGDKEVERSEFVANISPVEFVVNTSETMEGTSFFDTPVSVIAPDHKHLTSTPHSTENDQSSHSRKELFSTISLTVPGHDPEIPDLLEISPDRRTQVLDLIVDAPVFKGNFSREYEGNFDRPLPRFSDYEPDEDSDRKMASPAFADTSSDSGSENRIVEINYGIPIPGACSLSPIKEESSSMMSEFSIRRQPQQVRGSPEATLLVETKNKVKTIDDLHQTKSAERFASQEPEATPYLLEVKNSDLLPDPALPKEAKPGKLARDEVSEPVPDSDLFEAKKSNFCVQSCMPENADAPQNEPPSSKGAVFESVITSSPSIDRNILGAKASATDLLDNGGESESHLSENFPSSVMKSGCVDSQTLGRGTSGTIDATPYFDSQGASERLEENQHLEDVNVERFVDPNFPSNRHGFEADSIDLEIRPDSLESEEEYSEKKDWSSDASSSEDECETAGDGSVSTGAVFIWKEFDEGEKEGVIPEDDETEPIQEASPGDFVPSIWNSTLTPTKSALKSPEHTLNQSDHKKSVHFRKANRQKIYSYPPVDDSHGSLRIVGDSSPSSDTPRRQWAHAQNKEEQLKKLAQLADWEYDEDGNERSSPDYEFTVIAGEMPLKRTRSQEMQGIYQLSSLDYADAGDDDTDFIPADISTYQPSAVGSTFNPRDFFPDWARDTSPYSFKNGGLHRTFEIELPDQTPDVFDECDMGSTQEPLKTVRKEPENHEEALRPVADALNPSKEPLPIVCVEFPKGPLETVVEKDANGNSEPLNDRSQLEENGNYSSDTQNGQNTDTLENVGSSDAKSQNSQNVGNVGGYRHALPLLRLDFNPSDQMMDSDDSLDTTGFLS